MEKFKNRPASESESKLKEPSGLSGQKSSSPNWFQDDLTRRAANKRIGKGLVWTAVIGMASVTGFKLFSSDDTEVSQDSLDLQKKEGWNIGSTDRALNFDPTFTQNSASVPGSDWHEYLDPNKLIAAYQPGSASWQPYFVPTLIQSMGQPTLKDQIKPVKTTLMEETYGQALGLKELLSQSANANESLIVSELDGIQSVAFGAALADFAHIVPGFDNWPHPLGVVRSHETLGAMVYFAKEVEDKKTKLKDNAPAVLLLDANRLANYTDEENQFDNRFIAKLPAVNDLKQRGITNLLYVVKNAQRKEELDDLNEDFVEYQKQGITIKFMPLSEFKPVADTLAQTGATPANGTGSNTVVRNHYYYGGSPMLHWWFFSHYAFNPYPGAYTTYGGNRMSYTRPTTPAPFSPPSYRPVSRPTIFSGTRVGGAAGVGRNRPSGFGRTSVRMSSSGQVTGVRSGRSGSYGRSGGGFFGG